MKDLKNVILITVIGMTREDFLGAVYLFYQHGARQLMRPGCSPERDRRIGALPKLAVQSAGPPDHEGNIPCLVPPVP